MLNKDTGVATPQFSAGAFDGLAYDPSDDTLWWSPDASPNVHHVTTTGVELPGSPYTPIAASDSHLIPNSGLAVGLPVGGVSYIYLGSNGEGNIYKFNKATFTDLGVFAGVSGRDEDLECDSASFPGKNALWSKDAYNNKAYAFEVETGTCVSPPPPEKPLEGRMTGGGSVFTTDENRVTHGFELNCDKTQTPNNLEINWGNGNKFHLDTLTSASCTDDPSIVPNPPPAGFDTYKGVGTGKYNGVAGATATWTFTDAGEPGTKDTASIEIKDVGNVVVLKVSGKLNKGNHQAHKK